MRADARRNRERLLDAAVDLVLEVGGEPTRDAVATRAEVGIATLYRHFPDRQALLRAVALHVLDRTLTAGEAVLDRADSGAEALRAYLHLAVDHGLGAVHLLHPLIEDAEWPDRRARAETLLGSMVERAHQEGALRRDATVRDVAFAILRSCRPLAVGLGPDEERDLAHRHIDLCFAGLTSTG